MCDNCKSKNFYPTGSFYNNTILYDGGNRDDLNMPLKLDMTNKGRYGPNGIYYLDTRTSFASPEAQAYNKAGIIKINHIENDSIKNDTSLVPLNQPGYFMPVIKKSDKLRHIFTPYPYK